MVILIKLIYVDDSDKITENHIILISDTHSSTITGNNVVSDIVQNHDGALLLMKNRRCIQYKIYIFFQNTNISTPKLFF